MNVTLVIAPGLEAVISVVRAAWRSERPTLVLDYRGVASQLDASIADLGRATGGLTWLDACDGQRPQRLLRFGNSSADAQAAIRVLGALSVVTGSSPCREELRDAVAFALTVFSDTGGVWGLDDLGAALAQPNLIARAWPRDGTDADSALVRLRGLYARLRGLRGAWRLIAAPSAAPPPQAWSRLAWCELSERHAEARDFRAIAAIVRTLAEGATTVPGGRDVVALVPPTSRAFVRAIPQVPEDCRLIVATTDLRHGSCTLARRLGSRAQTLRIELQGPEVARQAAEWTDFAGDAARGVAAAARAPVGLSRARDAWQAAIPHYLPTSGSPSLTLARARAEARMLRTACAEKAEPVDLAEPTASLFDRLCDVGFLRQAWTRLVLDGTSQRSGVDGQRLHAFGADIDRQCQRLARELADGRYRPLPPSFFTIPKSDGDTRTIGMAAVRDRVVQRATLDLVTPLFEPHFSDDSFAFRPGRGTHHAVGRLFGFVRGGSLVLAQADVRRCFDTLSHAVILRQFGRRVRDARMVALLSTWLRAGMGCEALPDRLGTGVVQGWLLAPLLANAVLDDLDQQLHQRGQRFIRYADDISLFVHSVEEARAALAVVAELLESRLELRLHPGKTTVRAWSDGWDFLGFRLGGDDVLAMAPDRVARIELRLASDVDALAARLDSPARLAQGIRRLCLSFDGVVNYYARLGMTRALGRQLDHLIAVVAARRALLPAWASAHGSWLQWPDRELVHERWGSLAAVRGVADEPMDADCYPSGPGPSTEEPAPPPPRAPDVGHKAMPQVRDSATPVAERDGRTLHVLRGGAALAIDGDELLVRSRKQVLVRAPLLELECVIVQAFGVGLTVQVLWELADHGVSVVCASPVSDATAVVAAPGGARPEIRGAQARSLDRPWARQAAADMLRAKMGNQAALLAYFARTPGRREAQVGDTLRLAAAAIRELTVGVDPSPTPEPLEQLRQRWMGYEGLAAARYWQAIRHIPSPALGFEGRTGRNAHDAVNQALNYAYGLLYAEVWRAVVRVGLDPGLGLLHVARGRFGALVYDLIEELRVPLADRLVFGLLGRGWQPVVVESHGRALLRARDRHILVCAWRTQRKRELRHGRAKIKAGRLPVIQAAQLRDLVLEHTARYRAFRFRW